MSDEELDAIRQRKLRELQKKASLEAEEKPQADRSEVLKKAFKGRAWEVFNVAQSQFPSEMAKVEQLLGNLVMEGKIAEIDGEQLYSLLRQIGLPVRMNTTIRVLSHGKTESLAEKFRKSAE